MKKQYTSYTLTVDLQLLETRFARDTGGKVRRSFARLMVQGRNQSSRGGWVQLPARAATTSDLMI